MKFTKIYRLSLATAVGITFSFLTTGEAEAYTFTKIADSSGIFASFGSPVINNNGTVAFWAKADVPELPPGIYHHHYDYINAEEFIMTGNGESLTTIYSGDGLYGSNNLGEEPDINDDGTVVFKIFWNPAHIGGLESGIFANNGGNISTIYPFFRDYSNQDYNISVTIPSEVGEPKINNQGTVVFSACCEFYNGQFLSTITSYNNGLLTTIAMADPRRNDITIPWIDVSNPNINDRGTIFFSGVLKNGLSGIFTSDGGDIPLDPSATGISFGRHSINNRGQFAFVTTLPDGSQAIYRADPDPEVPKSVPEPTSVWGLFTAGALGLVKRRKR